MKGARASRGSLGPWEDSVDRVSSEALTIRRQHGQRSFAARGTQPAEDPPTALPLCRGGRRHRSSGSSRCRNTGDASGRDGKSCRPGLSQSAVRRRLAARVRTALRRQASLEDFSFGCREEQVWQRSHYGRVEHRSRRPHPSGRFACSHDCGEQQAVAHGCVVSGPGGKILDAVGAGGATRECRYRVR